MINVIIGAGELGSRHLPGLLQYEPIQEIYVVDPSETALQIAQSRAAEIAR
jgi:pyrroline-5-carboxylate reductase